MDIDLDDLKRKYKKKTRADILDLSQLQVMVPLLIREICRLEAELSQATKYIKNLELKRPPNEKKGRSGRAEWVVAYDMKKGRLKIKLKGIYDHKSAKMASNAVIAILPNVEKGFDVINDIRELSAITDMRTVFHLRKVRYLLVQAGVNRTVRVAENKESALSLLFEKYFKQGPDMMVAESMEDAESALDNQGKFLNV
ncbi:MAG: hypothetical protein KKD44_12165 [Proteobacteria bacterium]|nr:hypothetical protein [Pseudomonadota bacterium]